MPLRRRREATDEPGGALGPARHEQPRVSPRPHLPQGPCLPPRPGARALLSASPSAQVLKPLSETASTYPSAGFIHHSGQRSVKAGFVFLRPGRCLLTHGWGSRNGGRLTSTDVITQVYVWPSRPLSDCGSWQTLLNSRCGAVSASPSYEKSDYITEPTFSLTIVLGLIFNYSRNVLSLTDSNTSHTLQKCSPDYWISPAKHFMNFRAIL